MPERCRVCGDPVYGREVHDCCAVNGFPCFACEESKQLARTAESRLRWHRHQNAERRRRHPGGNP